MPMLCALLACTYFRITRGSLPERNPPAQLRPRLARVDPRDVPRVSGSRPDAARVRAGQSARPGTQFVVAARSGGDGGVGVRGTRVGAGRRSEIVLPDLLGDCSRHLHSDPCILVYTIARRIGASSEGGRI